MQKKKGGVFTRKLEGRYRLSHRTAQREIEINKMSLTERRKYKKYSAGQLAQISRYCRIKNSSLLK